MRLTSRITLTGSMLGMAALTLGQDESTGVRIASLEGHRYLVETSAQPGGRIEIWYMPQGMLGLRQGGLNWFEGGWLAIQMGRTSFNQFPLRDSRVVQAGAQGVIDFTWREEQKSAEDADTEMAEPDEDAPSKPIEPPVAWLRIRAVFLPGDEHTYLQVAADVPQGPKTLWVRASNLMQPLSKGARFAKTVKQSNQEPAKEGTTWSLDVNTENYAVWFDKVSGGAPCTLWFPPGEPKQAKIILSHYGCGFEASYPPNRLLCHLVFAEYGPNVLWEEKVASFEPVAKRLEQQFQRIDWSPAAPLAGKVEQMRREAQQLLAKDEATAEQFDSELDDLHRKLENGQTKWESSAEEGARAIAEESVARFLEKRMELLNKIKRQILLGLVEGGKTP